MSSDNPGILDRSCEVGEIMRGLETSDKLRVRNRTKKRTNSTPRDQEYWDTKYEVAREIEASRASRAIKESGHGQTEFSEESFEWLEKASESGEVDIVTDSQFTGRLVQHESKVYSYSFSDPEEAAEQIDMVPGKLMQIIERQPYGDRLLVQEDGNSFKSMYEEFESKPRFDGIEDFKEFYIRDK